MSQEATSFDPMARSHRYRKERELSSEHGPRGVLVFGVAALVGFACAGAVFFILRGRGEDPGVALAPAAPAIVPVFTDVTAPAGIRFRHEAGISGRYYYPEVIGAGCAFFDHDSDGDLDVYLVNGNRLPPDPPSAEVTNVLYRNNGDGTFTDVTAVAGVGDAAYGQGCCAADYDSDGDQDLYVTNFGPNVLYRNRGDGTFERAEGVAADPGWGQSCAFFDADGDGDLDLYAQNYLEYSIEHQQPWYVTIGGQQVLDYCSPSGYSGQQDRLFRNEGSGTLRDVTAESGIVKAEGTGMGLACADFDDDGDMDVAISNDSRPNFFFRNDGGGKFTECGLLVGFAYNGEGGTEAFMGSDAGDYDGDGLLDIAVPSLRSEGFNLYRNLGDSFAEVSVATGLDAATGAYTGFAPVFLDYDSDGDLDLFFTAGEVRMGRAEGGAEGSFTDRYAMRCILLENAGGRFRSVTSDAGPFFKSPSIFRAASAGDYDDDGDTDLLVTSMAGPAVLLRNDTKGGSWLGIRLVGAPPNRDAVGARLRLTVGGRSLVRAVNAGGSYLGQRDRRVLFGLGPAAAIEELRIRWPRGKETVHRGLAINRYHAIQEDAP